MGHYAPYGEVWDEQGTAQTPFGFTGEPTDQNGLVQLRARYYNPMLGVFPSLDPLEGGPMQSQSLNRYAYVQGNPANLTDPSGLVHEQPSKWDNCYAGRGLTRCEKCCIDKYHWDTFLGGRSALEPLYSGCVADCEFNSGRVFHCKKQEESPELPTPEISGCQVLTEDWDDASVVEANNCYTYAINLQLRSGGRGLNPGGVSGKLDDLIIESGGLFSMTCNFLTDALALDGIEPAEDPSACASRCSNGYPIYMVVAPSVDYHFYRMDALGVWTHKLGSGSGGPVLACDANGNLIANPTSANHDYINMGVQNYSSACGYYCVCPQEIQDLAQGLR